MNVLMVSAELAPLAKTGGLGDAVTGLAFALAAARHDVRVLLPRYEHVSLERTSAKPLAARGARHRFFELDGSAAQPAATRERDAPTVYLLDLAELTPGPIYFGDDRDAVRFIRLADAAVELPAALGWRPDVLHCHDWHAALVPIVQRARTTARAAPTALTLHNIGYQGVSSAHVLTLAGADDLRPLIPPDAIANGTLNFLRAGVRTAGVVTTVSPTYAREIRTPELGMGLDDALNARADDVVGILNGVDYAVWSPETDPFLTLHYDARDVSNKGRLKALLAERFGLPSDPRAPLVGVVSRLVEQKGIDLVSAALPRLLAESRASFVVLGNGDASITADLRAAVAVDPRRAVFVEGYDEALAHHIFAAADIVLVPSRYEPCGLTQMYALRYGAVPVVRATGGLADTIRHYDPALGTGNGSVFRDADVGGLLWGVRQALEWYEQPAAWSRLVANAMAEDFSWRKQARAYEALYRRLRG